MKKIHYYSELFTSLLGRDPARLRAMKQLANALCAARAAQAAEAGERERAEWTPRRRAALRAQNLRWLHVVLVEGDEHVAAPRLLLRAGEDLRSDVKNCE